MSKVKIGRPRSEKAREAILNATHALLDQKGGAALTIEAIAKLARVGKPTIYRWWPSLADIVLEALLHQADEAIPIPYSGSLETDLNDFLRQSVQTITDGAGEHLRFLMAQAQKDDGFRERFRDNFVAKRRATLLSVLNTASADRKSTGHDPELLTDMIFGAMWYRLLTGHADLDMNFASELAASITFLASRKVNPQSCK